MAAFVLYVVVGIVVGVVSGMLGIGGGILMIPVLMWVFAFEQRMAIGTTLGVLVVPVVLPAAYKYYSENLVDMRAAVPIAVGFALGGFFGAHLALSIPKDVLRIGFGLLLLYLGLRFVLFPDNDVRSAAGALFLVGLSFVSFIGLKLLGRNYRPPKLGEEIRRLQQRPPNEPDYYI